MKRIAVVILNWNGRKFLEQFLPSVVSSNPDFSEIIVADNASSDDSLAFLQQHYPAIRVIRNTSNGGYARGYNEALRQLGHEYLVLLNSDIEVTSNWLDPIVQLMDRDKRIGACQPRIRAYHDRSMFEYAGAAGGYLDKYGYPFCRGRIFSTLEKDEGQYDDEREVFWATGACLFVRASVFREAGELDEDFFAHMEEIDLCWRMKNLGYTVWYCPRSTVYHVGGGTLHKVNPQKTYLNFRNNLVLLCKNHAPGFFFLKLLLRMKLDGLAAFKFLLGGSPSHFWAVLRAHGYFYRTLGRTLRKRRELKQRIRKYAETAIYRRSIVFDYYLKGREKFSQLDPNDFHP
jgi:GT2 family glycosyltransferase